MAGRRWIVTSRVVMMRLPEVMCASIFSLFIRSDQIRSDNVKVKQTLATAKVRAAPLPLRYPSAMQQQKHYPIDFPPDSSLPSSARLSTNPQAKAPSAPHQVDDDDAVAGSWARQPARMSRVLPCSPSCLLFCHRFVFFFFRSTNPVPQITSQMQFFFIDEIQIFSDLVMPPRRSHPFDVSIFKLRWIQYVCAETMDLACVTMSELIVF